MILSSINNQINELEQDYNDLLDNGSKEVLKIILKRIDELHTIKRYVMQTIIEQDKENSETVRDYLNGEISKDSLASKFDVQKCNTCDNYELEEDLNDSEGMVNGNVGMICDQCLGDR